MEVDKLTKSELRVIKLLGNPEKIIADKLCLSGHTVRQHLRNVRVKLNMENTIQVAIWAAKNKII